MTEWLFRRRRVEAEMAEELRAHIEQRAEDLVRRGVTADEAGRRARIEFGGGEKYKEECRETMGTRLLDDFAQDVRFGLRMLRRSPGFTAVAVLTLALGIGANTAIFSLIEAVILKTLPVPNPQELVLFADDVSDGAISGEVEHGLWFLFSYESYEYFRDHDESFQDLCAFESNRHSLRIRASEPSDGRAIQIAHGKVVSGNYFSLMGVTPLVGRLLSPDDDEPGAPAVAVMSYAYWHSRYNDDPSVVGRTLQINETPFAIIGVAAREFYGESKHLEDLWFPLVAYPQIARQEPVFQDKNHYWLNMMGRLKPGVTLRRANVAVNLQLRQLLVADAGPQPSPHYQRAIADSHIELVPGAGGISFLRSQYSETLQILMVVAGFVLLIACANVANLLLSKGAARAKEISVRLATGASRARLIRQLFTEGLLLSCLGGIAGLLAAKWGANALFTAVVGNSQIEVSTSKPVLLFALGVSLLSGIVFGLVPALSASRGDLSASMKSGGTANCVSLRLWSSANALVIFQIVIVLPLLVVCGLFARTLQNLLAQSLGFSDEQVLVARIDPQLAGYINSELPVLYETLVAGVLSLPGVASATFDATTPLGGSESAGNISFELPPSTANSSKKSDSLPEASAHIDEVGGRYFETLGTPIILGRDLSPDDIRQKRRVCVINQTMARQYFGKTSPLGRRYSKGAPFDPQRAFEIVGVAADARYYSLRMAVPATAFNAELPVSRELFLVLRVAGNPAGIRTEASKKIAELAPRLPPMRVVPLRNQVEAQFQQSRTVVSISSAFGALSLLLACIGLYGTMSYRVSRRASEIGVRMALGAQRSNVRWMVMRESAMLVIVGLPAGVLLALASTRFVRSQLFGLSPSDPLTIVLAAAALALVAMIAGYVPARRAMRVDPIVVLRHE